MGFSPLWASTVGVGSSRQTQTAFTNGTLVTMPIATPVSVNTSGNMTLLDVTSDTSSQARIGLTSEACPSTASGLVVNAGRLEGVNLGFTPGDAVYAGLTPGTLTNVKPDLTVMGWEEGYWVIFYGVYVVNQFNPGLYDIQLMPTVIGVL